MCINSYYKDDKPYCYVSNDICAYVKYCNLENRWKLSERCFMCKMYNKPVIKLPKNSYKVLFTKRNKLYVSIPEINMTMQFNNPFEYEPKYVYLKKIKDFEYKIITEEEFYKTEYEFKKNIKTKNTKELS
jgi:hypothetical protein